MVKIPLKQARERAKQVVDSITGEWDEMWKKKSQEVAEELTEQSRLKRWSLWHYLTRKEQLPGIAPDPKEVAEAVKVEIILPYSEQHRAMTGLLRATAELPNIEERQIECSLADLNQFGYFSTYQPPTKHE